MNLGKRLLLHAWYGASLPYRAAWNRRAAAAGQAPIIVLFYHRVAEDQANSWTCSPEMFARQVHWLRQRFDMVSLAEAQRRIRAGFNERACVSITFDDGYAENCRFALPFLVRQQVPCTYFVATRHVFEGLPFPHDVAQGNRFPPNTLEQLREAASEGIEIGAHTRTHADLGSVDDPQRLHDEVITAGEELQAALGRPVRYFAFPYGQFANLHPAAFQLAFEAGYEGVCSAYGGFNFPGDDAFHLQRIHGDDDMLRLKNWVTVDPRKLGQARYCYETPQVPTRRSPRPRGGEAPAEPMSS